MSNLQPSAWLWSFLESYEEFRGVAYKPTPNDVWTIGYGHTRGVRQGDTCTLPQAQAFLQGDVAGSVGAVNASVRVPLIQCQFDALVSLVFNCGPQPLNAHLGALLNAGNYAACAADFLNYDRQARIVLNGLENRREAEMHHFLGR